MLPKRPFPNGGDNEQGCKRSKNSVRDIFGNFSMDDYVLKMEPQLRAIVREAVEETVSRVFQQSSRPSSSVKLEPSAKRAFLLQFVDQFPSTIFTNGKIETEDGNPVRVVLLDANTKSIVLSGPLSSMKIEIVALDGDFGSDDQEEWSCDEFSSKIIREREGKRPLVTGELTVSLKDGVGRISDVSFTDNSSWIRCRKFRLGAIPVQKNLWEVQVREARSAAFVVKDHRGESYKKHYPPRQNDEVWRLEKIAKDGAYHKRLASNGICNVKHFLQLHTTNPTKLRKMFDGISNRTWDTIIAHTATCVVDDDDELYAYHEAGQGVSLLFNSIYKLVGVAFDGQNYERLDKLNISQLALAENLKMQAYKNVNEFISISPRVAFPPSRSLTIMPAAPFDNLNIGLQQFEFPIACQDQPHMQLDFNNSLTSTSYPITLNTDQLEVTMGQQTNNPTQGFSSSMRNSFKLGDLLPLFYTGETSWTTNTSQWPLVPSATQDISHVEPTWQTFNPTWDGQGSGNAFILGDEEVGIFSSHPSSEAHMYRIRNPKEGWFKLKVAFKLKTVMRDLAAKRTMAQLLCVDY